MSGPPRLRRAPVLVTGAAGKTGLAVTAALARRGVPVRAGLHGPASEPAAHQAGARQCLTIDLVSAAGLPEAMRGVSAVYLIAPNMHPDEVGITVRVLEAAGSAGVARVAYHSVLHPHHRGMPHHLRKADAEQLVRGCGMAWTVLQPASYQQNLLAAARSGRIVVPYGVDVPFTPVDLADVAEVAAAVLTEPGHERASYELAGPDLLDVATMAEQAGQVLGRPVIAEAMTPTAWARGPGSGLPASQRADLLAMFAAYDAGGLAGNPGVLAWLLGRPPGSWRALLNRSLTP